LLQIYANEELAVKAAGHEMHGLNAFMSCGLQHGIAFPLMVCHESMGGHARRFCRL